MATLVSSTWVLTITPKETLSAGLVQTQVESVVPTESPLEVIFQSETTDVNIGSDPPIITSVGEAIQFWEDFWGFVSGTQKTVYITDERYLDKHDL